MDTKDPNCEAPAGSMKPAVVAVIVLCVLAVTIGIMYFMVVRPLKLKLAQAEGALDSATNLTNPEKGVANNAALPSEKLAARIQNVAEANQEKGLVTPQAVALYNSQTLKP